jgi:ribosomal protein L11 methyltransferase
LDVPYRIDVDGADAAALDRLIDLGALDIDRVGDDRVAALLPDTVGPEEVASALGPRRVVRSPARGRDAGSVWVLQPRPVGIGRIRIVPAGCGAAWQPGDLLLVDGAAFGTGLHPTTALCLALVDEMCEVPVAVGMLDVGTGSGILALAALSLGVRAATAIDIDEGAVAVAMENARLNGLAERLTLLCGGPRELSDAWPLVVANVLAAPLIEMAPVLARRVAHDGRLVLSGIPAGLEGDVERAYRHVGMQRIAVRTRDGWSALLLQASW